MANTRSFRSTTPAPIADAWDMNADRDAMLTAAAAATHHSDDVSRDRDTIERLGQAVETLDTAYYTLRERSEAELLKTAQAEDLLFQEKLEVLRLMQVTARLSQENVQLRLQAALNTLCITVTGKSAAEVNHELDIEGVAIRERARAKVMSEARRTGRRPICRRSLVVAAYVEELQVVDATCVESAA